MRVLIPILASAALVLVAAAGKSPPATPAGAPAIVPSPVQRTVYEKHCAPCHGVRGRGDGPAARFLDPPPRDFTRGAFRLVSTTNGIPSDTDLFEVISAGLPGTAMLPFPHLPPDDRWELVRTIREFRRQALHELYEPLAEDAAELDSWIAAETTPGPRVTIGPKSPATVDARARGRLHFQALCAACHGPDGRGLAMEERTTVEGHPIRPRDLTRGVLKGGLEDTSLVARIRCGMPGTPMPAVPTTALDDAGVWDLVHYLDALIPKGAQALHDPASWVIEVPRLEGPLPQSPADPRFAAAPELHVALAPFRSGEATVRGLMVRALHDGRYVVFAIRYADPTRDIPGATHLAPPDGLAIRVTNVPDPPVLPTPGLPLPLDRALFLAGPMPDDDDPVFDAVQPRFENPDAVCVSPIGPERVGQATWRDGIWSVVMAIQPDRAGAVDPDRPMPVSFAVFDGSIRRGPLPVAFSAWHELRFAR